MDKQMIEEMAKLDIEQSVSGYSAFINDMRISKSKPLSVSKTIMSFDCPKKYIYEAIGIPEGAVVLTREEVKIYQKIYDFMKEKGIVSVEEMKTLISFALKSSMLKSHIVKETAEKIMNDISNDIIVVNTKEYGNIEVVPVERLQEIIQTLGVNE